MNVVVIDTISEPMTVRLFAGKVTDKVTITPRTVLSERLLPAVDTLLARHGVSTGQLERIAVVNAPGSFTSLRIGIATANALAYATGCDLVALPADTPIKDQPTAIAAASPVDRLVPDYGREARITQPKTPPPPP